MVNIISNNRLRKTAQNSKSMREFLGMLGLSKTNGNYRVYKEMLKNMNVDISHWRTYSANSGGVKPRIELKDILIENSRYSNITNLKQRLIKAGIIQNRCCLCPVENSWNGQPLVLVLDHINGNSFDHRIENLRLLCPNCNSQQLTFCRPKLRKSIPLWECPSCHGSFDKRQINDKLKCYQCRKKETSEIKLITVTCPLCGEHKDRRAKKCRQCEDNERQQSICARKFNISQEELLRLVWEMSTEKVGKLLGVSGKAVEKRCKKFGINKPPRGYWAKKTSEKCKN